MVSFAEVCFKFVSKVLCNSVTVGIYDINFHLKIHLCDP